METKSFKEVVELWLADKKQYVKKSTYCAYSLMVSNHLMPQFAGPEDLTEEKIQAFVLAKLKAGLSLRSVRDILMVLKMIRRYGVKHGCWEQCDVEVRFPTERRRELVATLNRSDQKCVMNYIQSHFSFMNLGIYICLCAGLRIGEVCALRWEDIDVDAGVIRVTKTIQRVYVKDASPRTELLIGAPKSQSSIRDVPIARELMRMIRPLKKVINSGFYVLTNSEKPTEPRTYRNHYERLMRQLGMPHLKFHGLRHSFATRCVESRCDYKTVSVLLGHSNISTTLNLYVHPDIEQKKKCVEQMLKSLK